MLPKLTWSKPETSPWTWRRSGVVGKRKEDISYDSCYLPPKTTPQNKEEIPPPSVLSAGTHQLLNPALVMSSFHNVMSSFFDTPQF